MVKVFNLPSIEPGASLVVKLVARYTPAPVTDVLLARSIPMVTTTIEINDGQMLRGPFWVDTEMKPMYLTLFPFISQ